jgi:hypothetical protein
LFSLCISHTSLLGWFIVEDSPRRQGPVSDVIRLVLVEVSWLSFQHININILKTVQKNFIPI